MHDAARQLEKLRQLRCKPLPDLSIARLVGSTADHARRTQKKLGELIALWEEIVPAEVAAHTSVTGLRAGVLHVVVDSSSAAYDLDRLLRGGVLDVLRKRFRGSLVRVKTRVGNPSL
jgi:predicted nucleic acid-binding Zn ribbon protein